MGTGLIFPLMIGAVGVVIGLILGPVLKKARRTLTALPTRIASRNENIIPVSATPSFDQILQGVSLLHDKLEAASFSPHMVITFDPGGMAVAGILTSKMTQPIVYDVVVIEPSWQEGERPQILANVDLGERDHINILIVADIMDETDLMSDVVRHFKVRYPKADVRSLALVDLRDAHPDAEGERPRPLDFVALKVRGGHIKLPWKEQDQNQKQAQQASETQQAPQLPPPDQQMMARKHRGHKITTKSVLDRKIPLKRLSDGRTHPNHRES